MKILTFTNQKGGTGKTTSALSVGAGLTRKGYKVLIVDLDPQGNATTAAGITPDEKDPTVYEVLKGSAKASGTIRATAGGYDIIPTDIRQSGADIELASAPGRDFILLEALDEVKDRYDYAIIDSPPNLSVITLMGLTAADGIVITLKADYLALNGVAQLKDTINLVKRRLNPRLEVTGVLLTFYDRRKNLDTAIAAQAEEGFPGKVFRSRISQAVALAEAPAAGRDIFQYKPGSKPAKQYEDVVDEIIARTAET
jgi:chromosome partitioning protein